MSKRHEKDTEDGAPRGRGKVAEVVPAAAAQDGTPSRADGKLSRKAYDKALHDLHVELVKLQQWVQATGAKVCILFEGRADRGRRGDAALLQLPQVVALVASVIPLAS